MSFWPRASWIWAPAGDPNVEFLRLVFLLSAAVVLLLQHAMMRRATAAARAVVDKAGKAMVVLGADEETGALKITSVNRAFEALTGFVAAEVLGRANLDFLLGLRVDPAGEYRVQAH